MVRMCFLCKNRADKCSLFGFPKAAERRDIWKRACDLQEYEVSTLYVCQEHFKSEDFIEPNAQEFGNRLRLKQCAVPHTKVWEEKLIVVISDMPEQQEIAVDPLAQPEEFEQLSPKNEEISSDGTDQDLTEPSSPRRDTIMVDLSSPRRAKRHLDRAYERIAQQNRKIRTLQQSKRRLQRKIKSLEDFINHLQNQINASENPG